jgi:hypothetical protein
MDITGLFITFFLAVLEFELRAWCLLGRYPTLKPSLQPQSIKTGLISMVHITRLEREESLGEFCLTEDVEWDLIWVLHFVTLLLGLFLKFPTVMSFYSW